MILEESLEVIVEVNFSQLKILVVNNQFLINTKIRVLYKKILNSNIIDFKTKAIIDINKIQT